MNILPAADNAYADIIVQNQPLEKPLIYFFPCGPLPRSAHEGKAPVIAIVWRSFRMEKYKVGVIGGTGMVGQRFVTLMENH